MIVVSDASPHDLIPSVKPSLDQLRTVVGFYISEALYNRVLADEVDSQ